MEQIKQFLRSRSFIGTIVSLLAIAAISLAFFYPDALEGNVLRQHDTQLFSICRESSWGTPFVTDIFFPHLLQMIPTSSVLFS